MSTHPNQPAVSSSLGNNAERPIQPDQMSGDKNLDSYFHYKPGRDTASDVRSALLVVMALIAAATFQAGLNPPGGVWQETKKDPGENHVAGTAILGSDHLLKCRVFYFFNTLALATSFYVIMYLVYGFPFFVEIWIGVFSFFFTYGFSVRSLSPRGAACVNVPLVTVACLLPLVATFIRMFGVQLIKRRRTSLQDQSI